MFHLPAFGLFATPLTDAANHPEAEKDWKGGKREYFLGYFYHRNKDSRKKRKYREEIGPSCWLICTFYRQISQLNGGIFTLFNSQYKDVEKFQLIISYHAEIVIRISCRRSRGNLSVSVETFIRDVYKLVRLD